MNGAFATIASLLGAYLIGSIPFGLLIARWFGGVDIRTVGSGNIGATNVGRVLGFRFFVVVFLLDFLKGLLPTHYLPPIASGVSSFKLPHLPVGVAIATILGHNFPLYLRFKGGKGVATSLGAVSALDAFASVSAATGFTISLIMTRFVSMSSIVGGLVWMLAHFLRIEKPFAREEIAMTLASFGLMGLLIARHRKNFVRIGNGTEPKVNFRKKKKGDEPRPTGRVLPFLVVGLAVVAGGTALTLNAARQPEADFGPYHAVEIARVATGHQRAERLAFADHGRLLAATCPRYNRAMLYRVTSGHGLELVRDITLGGRPVAVSPTADRLYVLVRPTNDARHVEEGWWETFDFEGNPAGPRIVVGYYPDDMTITPDGRHALVLTSGRGEGDDHRPAPALTVYDLATSAMISRLNFDQTGDDLARVALSADGKTAAVSIQGSNAVAWVDLADRANPALIARRDWPAESSPGALHFDRGGGLMVVDETGEALNLLARPDAEPVIYPVDGGIGDVVDIPGEPDYRAVTEPYDSGVAFLPVEATPEFEEARLAIKGRANLASTRPLGLAFDPSRSLLAVSNRSGGSIHLVSIRKLGVAR
ncbi:glycerol-3-phosphate 1-O-acyltransferase PlsY [Tundrisphaera lichenicola]|uniref:glycerol-3-phosphate 1-O-acyltransferase PlsY n=1 Tax=Tundrisphaera lichenicola TaxID=2029860 RepID=UPI003EB99002